jgi:hypothetical protein
MPPNPNVYEKILSLEVQLYNVIAYASCNVLLSDGLKELNTTQIHDPRLSGEIITCLTS